MGSVVHEHRPVRPVRIEKPIHGASKIHITIDEYERAVAEQDRIEQLQRQRSGSPVGKASRVLSKLRKDEIVSILPQHETYARVNLGPKTPLVLGRQCAVVMDNQVQWLKRTSDRRP